MRIEIIAVGSELLSPFFQDTNSLFLTARLNDLGLDVFRKTVVGDEPSDLRLCFEQALAVGSDFVFVIGGLGPTLDDITREALAEALRRPLVRNEEILKTIEERFRRRGRDMPAANGKQADLLDGAEVLENKSGSAPGQWIAHGRTTFVLFPGPPVELKPMFEESVWPRFAALGRGFAFRKVLKITGMTESEVDAKIADVFPRKSGLRLTILARPGQIEIHLTSFSRKSRVRGREALERLSRSLRSRLGDNVFSTDGKELEEVVGILLRRVRKTLAVAESCTGGLLASRITDVSGSSGYFLEGCVAYSNGSKVVRLGVPKSLIEAHGAVSPEAAESMAAGIRKYARADFGLAITGIAGPTGGSSEKPVGLVYTSLAWDGGVRVERNVFLGKRAQVKFQASQKALDLLRRFLQNRGRLETRKGS